jgi:dolichol-phosphate mannosyltransferase
LTSQYSFAKKKNRKLEKGKSELLIVIPTYNERENIENLIHLLLEIESKPDTLVVDDNSPDGTGKILDRLSLEYPGRIYVIHRRAKLGIGSAYIIGFKYALKHDYEYILTMDADFSHHPKYIQRMLDESIKSQIVIGSRYIKGGGTKNWSIYRQLNSKIANLLAKNMLHLNCMDCTAGFRLYKREVLQNLNLDEIYSNGYSFLIEFLYKCQLNRVQISEIPITFEDRKEGASKISKYEIFNAVKTLLKYWLSPLSKS